MIARVRIELGPDETSVMVLAEQAEAFIPAGALQDDSATFIDAGLRLERLIDAARASTTEQIKELSDRIEDFKE